MLAPMRRFIITCLLFCSLFVLTTSASHADGVTNVTIMRGQPTTQTQFALEINKAVPYRAFVLNNPPRMVIDLPLMNWTAPLNKGDRNGTIKSYRKGVYQKDTLRIVLDLARPAIISSHSRQSSKNANWQYMFNLKPVSPVEFQQAINKVSVGGGTPQNAVIGATKAPPRHIDDPEPITSTDKKTTFTASTSSKKPLIVIDAGHGGVDPGALATNGAYEKNITLATAKELKQALLATGKYRVKLTRETDIYIKLPDRVRIARQANADMFISLHADTIGRPQVRGSSVYTLSDKASDIETAKLADRENAVDTLVNVNVGSVDADVADILIDLVTRDTMNQSKVLAETVVSTFKRNGVQTLPQLPHRSAGFAVLKAPDIPSVLIEMGYLSNKAEADQLASASHRAKIAQAIAKVVDRFYNETSATASY